MEYYRHTIGS